MSNNREKSSLPLIGMTSEKSNIADFLDSNIDCNIFSDSVQLNNTCSEIQEKFTDKKRYSILLADSFKRLRMPSRSDRVRSCGSYLEFTEYSSDSENLHLTYANFCRDRLCPMCAWRRSLKLFGQVSRVMDVLENDYAFLFLTLTVPNVSAVELPAKIDQMQKSFNSYMRYASIKRAVKGHLRILEITYNKVKNTYHPHFHVILAVSPSYFKKSDYIKRDQWLSMWQRAMKDSSITQVDVRRVRDKYSSDCADAVKSLKSAVAEIAKYAVKSNDYIFPFDPVLTDKCVFALSKALHGRRLIAFGGVFEEIRKQLDIDCDSDDSDLVNVDEFGELRGDLALCIYRFSWSSGAYKLISFENVVSPLVDPEDDESF